MIKKYFITGLIVLLPLTITIIVIKFVLSLLTNPFLEITRPLIERWNLNNSFFFFSEEQMVLIISQMLILGFLFLVLVVLGMLTRWILMQYLLKLTDFIFLHIPVISSIYKTAQDVINTLFGSQARAFKQVVLVPYPRNDTYVIGLITKDTPHRAGDIIGVELLSVFVPTTPNPTSGFLMLYRKEEVIYIDMSIEEAFKYIISCGVIHS
ncbi:MAG: hypothetical protein K0S74_1642 [Chlamydiales bacterium]|jgi:uncharacterized membrane protein|nr:hypothetical protein [Chlamydiales bacterium]